MQPSSLIAAMLLTLSFAAHAANEEARAKKFVQERHSKTAASLLSTQADALPLFAAKIVHVRSLESAHEGWRVWVSPKGEVAEVDGRSDLKAFFKSLQKPLGQTVVKRTEAKEVMIMLNRLLNYYTTEQRKVQCESGKEKMDCTMVLASKETHSISLKIKN